MAWVSPGDWLARLTGIKNPGMAEVRECLGHKKTAFGRSEITKKQK
jgi:hypothetical protein